MFKKIIFIFVILFFTTPLIFILWWNNAISCVNTNSKESKTFIISSGWSVAEIAQKLEKEGLIKNAFAFKLMTKKKNISTKIQAGRFQLSPAMNMEEIALSLTQGSQDLRITIQEGLRREEIAVILANKLPNFDSNEFIKKTINLEGYLFPDTYLVPQKASAQKIIEILTQTFEKKYNSIEKNSNLDRNQTVILASIIEREARHDKDRRIISGILSKRLKIGMALQVDATIQYVKANIKCNKNNLQNSCKWWPQVTGTDLKKISSPFNTYENPGLPPTPICNPSLSSLTAVSNPQESNYLYYLSEVSGTMHYAQTIEEHNENIRKYLN